MIKNRNLKVGIVFLLVTIFGLLVYADAITFSSNTSNGEILAEQKLPATNNRSTNSK